MPISRFRPSPSVTIFDLDNTLLAGDSDYQWGTFLADTGVVDAARQRRENERFMRDYDHGTLDMDAFMAFQLEPLATNEMRQLVEWRTRYLATVVEPMILASGRALVDAHRRLGRELLVATATNSFITRPIASALGIENLVATEPEIVDGRFTGRLARPGCLGAGKRDQVLEWLATKGYSPEDCYFYSDSRNDLALLEIVAIPVAVDPDETLANIAKLRGWSIITLR